MAQLEDLHEWVSFEDPDEHRTWVFDVTFLTSNWMCIFGQGCPGVLTEPAPELVHGCCSYGAHFTGKDDRQHVEKMAERLAPDQWQFRKQAKKRGGPIKVNRDGDTVTRLVDCLRNCHWSAVSRSDIFSTWRRSSLLVRCAP